MSFPGRKYELTLQRLENSTMRKTGLGQSNFYIIPKGDISGIFVEINLVFKRGSHVSQASFQFTIVMHIMLINFPVLF